MWIEKILLIFGILHAKSVIAQWSCTEDTECTSLAGSVCTRGTCACPTGQQPVLGGTVCANLAPYHTSACVEDHQCSRLLTTFECRRGIGSEEGECFCQSGHHYFLGRCWRTVDYGGVCSRDEECIGVIRDPYSLQCNGTCGCAEGYYNRQRGECRKIGYAVGDGCVLSEDCQFAGGICDISTFTCTDRSSGTRKEIFSQNVTKSVMTSFLTRQHGNECSVLNPCSEPFECALFGSCICPVGYYASDNGTICYAELGSRSTVDQCIGLFAEVRDGICTCMANFFFEENMRDCTKVSRQITDSCVTDANCFTFGAAARCGPPQEPWQLRMCECVPELAVWDSARMMCRLFAGIGETCEVDSDCLAGEFEIQCAVDETGQGYCACPEGLVAVDGLCLTTGLALGDACQATQECTETPNTVCANDRCSCGDGYQEIDDYCAPIIGGTCVLDTDCVIENTICLNNSNEFSCQCGDMFVAYNDECWPSVSEFEAPCNVSVQCSSGIGEASVCQDGRCVCQNSYHYRDGACWPITRLFDACSRTSECYLTDMSERVVCRNSICQCDFDFPYSEELRTCMSSSTNIVGSALTIMTALLYLLSS